MINKIPLLIFMIFLGGCETKSTMMVNPENGDVYDCSFSGVGGSAMYVQSVHDQCVEELREVGFEPVKNDQKSSEIPKESNGN